MKIDLPTNNGTVIGQYNRMSSLYLQVSKTSSELAELANLQSILLPYIITASDFNALSSGGMLANTKDVLLTTSTLTNVLSYTPLASGNFTVSIYFRVITATTNVTVSLTYTDGGGAVTNAIYPIQSKIVGSYSLNDVFFNATTSAPIIIKVTAGTANQVYVSTSIVGA